MSLLTYIISSLLSLGFDASPKPTISIENFQSLNWNKLLNQSEVPVYGYKIIKTYPHDTDTFTEGLEINDGYLYESNGLYKKSYLRRIDKNSGQVLLEYRLPPQYFAEGITVFKNHIYQLTYQSNLGFIYNKTNFALEKTFQLPSPGWGLTHDDKELIMSNGTSALIFLNPSTLTMSHFIIAHYKQQNISQLNSLGFINGKIYANIFETDIIAIISPRDGAIEAWINLHGLAPDANQSNPNCASTGCVLNGIAYDQANNELLVTGKNWPFIFAIDTTRSIS